MILACVAFMGQGGKVRKLHLFVNVMRSVVSLSPDGDAAVEKMNETNKTPVSNNE